MGTLSREAQEKAKNWLKKNGFDEKGYTYILVGLNSYDIKDELKGAGWVYSPQLRWHKADPGEYSKNVKCIHWTSYFELMAWGDFVPIMDTQKKIDEMIAAAHPKEETESGEWMGEIGDRLKEIPVTLTRIKSFTGQYGYSQICNFITEEGNHLVWFTTTDLKIEEGESCFLSGTVKKHEEYRGLRNTILTRCRIK